MSYNANSNDDTKYIDEQNKKNDVLGETLYSFSFVSSWHHLRGKNWYIGLTILVSIAFFIGLWQKSISMCLLSIMIGVVYWTFRHNEPKENTIHITTLGILNHKEFYQYTQAKKFWIIWEPNHMATLHIVLGKPFSKEVMIPIEERMVAPLRAFLAKHIPEEKDVSERFSDFLIRALKL